MKGVLFLRPEAEQDLATARDWYDQQRIGLGDQFLDAVALALRVLARAPELPRFYHQRFRRVMLHRFPYKIFYQVIGDRIVVFRVLHAKQDHGSNL
jgi:plasmid stabilization system protein ParE